MSVCPRCHLDLVRVFDDAGVSWRCDACGGRFATLPFLRKRLSSAAVNRLWQDARAQAPESDDTTCPDCGGTMVRLRAMGAGGGPGPALDVCRSCQAVWFDRDEFESLPPVPAPVPEAGTDPRDLSPEVREKLALIEIERIAQKGDEAEESPSGWRALAYFFGFPVKIAGPRARRFPFATLAIAALTTAVSVWALDEDEVFHALALVPSRLGEDLGLSLITSTLLHGDWWHLAGNLYSLFLFGALVEERLGWKRYLSLYALAGLVGGLLHIALDPRGDIPCVGASGCIAGVLAYSAQAFPDVRLTLFNAWLAFSGRSLRFSARTFFSLWMLLQFWLAWQQIRGDGNISALAHLGGAIVGWLFFRRNRASPRFRGVPSCQSGQ